MKISQVDCAKDSRFPLGFRAFNLQLEFQEFLIQGSRTFTGIDLNSWTHLGRQVEEFSDPACLQRLLVFKVLYRSFREVSGLNRLVFGHQSIAPSVLCMSHILFGFFDRRLGISNPFVDLLHLIR